MRQVTRQEVKDKINFFEKFAVYAERKSFKQIYSHISCTHYIEGDEQGDTDGYTTITLSLKRGDKEIPLVDITSQGNTLEYDVDALVNLASLHHNKPLPFLIALQDNGFITQVKNEALLYGNFDLLKDS